MSRIHEITCGAAKEELVFRRLEGHESLGRPFEYRVEMYCSSPDLKAADILGTPMVVSVLNTETNQKRFFHGLVASFCYAGDTGREHVYRAVLRPWIWFLTRTTDCRIFQNVDVKEILTKVFKTKNSFSDFDTKGLKGTYRKWEYCVQYRESDFDFASRLMEQEGVYYYFEHTQAKHTLVLCDASASHTPITGDPIIPFRVSGEGQLESERIAEWLRTETLQSTKFQYRDFDFEKPSANIETRANLTQSHKLATFEQYDYPGEYTLVADGNRYAKIRSEEIGSQYSVAIGAARSYRLASGYKFTMSDFVRKADNMEYLVTSTQLEIVSGEVGFLSSDKQNLFDISFTAIDAKQAYRAPQITPRPRIAGPQTAIVVGKAGEEIWTDKYGRVKVQFHWDREGKKDENSSCWIRVAQVWAGKNWGAMHIPRLGQEVVVEFLEGDPDRPLITGRVYNNEQLPPYDLPDNATQSGIKSRSTKKGLAENANELRFEDKKDLEQVYFHAERNMDRVVENNETVKVGYDKHNPGDQLIEIYNNRKLRVGMKSSAPASGGASGGAAPPPPPPPPTDGSETIEVFNNQSIKVGDPTATGSSQTLEIFKNRTKTIKTGNETIKIEMGNRDTNISMGNDTLTLGMGNLSIDCKLGKVTIKAMQAIELLVGASSIKVEPAQISIQAPIIKVAGQGMVDINAPMTTVKGSAMLVESGGVVMIN